MINISKPHISEEEINGVVDVLKSGMIAQGPKVKEFEEEFAKICGVKHAIAVTSGTTALHSALYASGVKYGDEVITSPFTFVATSNSIFMQGAKPVFVDINLDSFNIDPEKIEEKITEKTKAIIPVNLYGNPADYKKILAIAKKHDLAVIEDAAQSHLGEHDNKMSGGLADFAAFSFYATKNMMTGEGGMITTNDDEKANLLRSFRHHGQSVITSYDYVQFGYNYRMTDIQAAIGLAQIKKIHEFTKKRVDNARYYNQELKGIKGIVLPSTPETNRHVYHQYTIRVTDECKHTRDELLSNLKEHGINAGVYYPKPLHLIPTLDGLGYKEGDLPNAELASKQVISLPVHPGLTPIELEFVVNTIKEICE